MANSKISALTSAATVVGTEVLPIVQSSATVKVSVANLTPGLGTITAAKGGTGQTSYAVGDIIYADTTTTLAKLADVATGNALISGGVGVAPNYGKIGLTTHVSGTLPVANGGTNLTSFTANGIVYASSTSVLATGSGLVFDGTNMGINVTPSAWLSTWRAIQNTGGALYSNSGNQRMGFNAYLDSAVAFRYIATGFATDYQQGAGNGSHIWWVAPSGTAGNLITFTQAMTLLTSGNLGIGVTSPAVKLDVLGTVQAAAAATQDAVRLAGRAGGTGTFAVTLTPTTLTASRTLTLPDATTTVVGTDATQTLTNKWVQPRVLASTANSATPTLNTDNYDMMVITGQTVAITSFSTNLTGTPVNGQKLIIAITGTAAIGITWGASFEASTVALPTTTVTTNRLDVGFIWNVATTKWRCVAVA
jgi:hypothetical protein